MESLNNDMHNLSLVFYCCPNVLRIKSSSIKSNFSLSLSLSLSLSYSLYIILIFLKEKNTRIMKYGHVKFHERWPLLTIHSSVWHNKWIKKNKVDASDLCKINLQKTNFPLSSNLSSNSWQGYDGFKMHHIKKTYECVFGTRKNLCLTYQYEIFHTHMWMQKMTDESYQMVFVSWISEENFWNTCFI